MCTGCAPSVHRACTGRTPEGRVSAAYGGAEGRPFGGSPAGVFRRKWGRGCQAEVNRVLRAFFKLHMSRMVKGEAGFEALLAEVQGTPRPRIGEPEREMGGDGVFGGLGEG